MVNRYYFSTSSCDLIITNGDNVLESKTVMRAELKDGYLNIEDAAFNKDLLLLDFNSKCELKLVYDLAIDGEEIEMTTIIPNAIYKGIIGFIHGVDELGNITYQFEVHTTNIKFEELTKN